ncbi:MAG: hypothetical protein IJC81_00510 [Clostridia bacterium]|nr:hypothetical protein [Clostridia bacterium]
MKLKNFFKILGLSIFAVALIIFMLSQNPKTDIIELIVPVVFGIVLAFSGACLVASEIFGKLEDIEKKNAELEKEMIKLKNKDKE